jgi:hypothetical protein
MCYTYLKSFTNEDAVKNHVCSDSVEDTTKNKNMKQKNGGNMLKYLARYLKSSHMQGSKDEIIENLAKALFNCDRKKNE